MKGFDFQSFGDWNLRERACCCCSVAESYLTLFDPMDCSTPGFPVLHHCWSLLKLMSIESVMLSNHLVLCRPLLLLPLIFPSIRSFPVSHLFTWGGQSIGFLTWGSDIPMDIKCWFPLGSTGLISLQSKGFSRVFSNTKVQKHQFFSAQFSL